MFLCLSIRVLYPREIKTITEIQIPRLAPPLIKGARGDYAFVASPFPIR
jgi:hypothetical protein